MVKIDLERLELAQAIACMSSKEIQDIAGISGVALSNIRRGVSKPKPKTVGLIARALGVSVKYLIGEEG